MEHEYARRPGLMGYDERTETWYVRSAESQRLMLTRQSLTHLVEMYNSVHTGRPLSLIEERELHRLRDACREAESSLALAESREHRLPHRLTRLLVRIAAGLIRPRS